MSRNANEGNRVLGRGSSLPLAILAVAALAIAGCAVGSPDPLAYEADGTMRSEIDIEEIEEAGVPVGCEDLLDQQADTADFGAVPIDGLEGFVLVVADGVAVCVAQTDELTQGTAPAPLPSLPGLPVDLTGTTPEGTSAGRELVLDAVAGRVEEGHPASGPQPSSIPYFGPTPQPAIE